MSDELDGQLLRHFAASQRPLADPRFVDQVTRRLRARAAVDGAARVLHGVVRSILSGLGAGLAAPLRLRYGALLALIAATVTIGSALLSSL